MGRWTNSPERSVFADYLGLHDLRLTSQRDDILEEFLKSESHVSFEELHSLVIARNPRIGIATVYRTLNLLVRAGLARQVDFGDGRTRFEHSYRHTHHDHLVCQRCGRLIEFYSPSIEKLQAKVAEQHKFKPSWHKMEVFGLCGRCQKKGSNKGT